MSERKVLNKYYPKDYDPSKIPRAKRPRNRQWTIRTMAPFNMRCNTCGEYVYKGKKFNSRQELAEGEDYLGLKIFRFYIKCPKCVSEITFKTDPQSVDYVLEAGATRNFEALRTAELMAQKEATEKEAELENNPMKMLENRTKQSQREMDMIETLEDLRELNQKHAKVDMNELIERKVEQQKLFEEKLKQVQDEEDEAFVQSVFGKNSEHVMKRLSDSEESDCDTPTPSKQQRLHKPTDFLTQESTSKESTQGASTSHPTSCTVIDTTAASTGTTITATTISTQPSKDQQKRDLLKNSTTIGKPKKTNLSMLVKKKNSTLAKPNSSSKPSLYEMVKKKEAELVARSTISAKSQSGSDKSLSSNVNKKNDSKSSDYLMKETTAEDKGSHPSALSMLGGYSDSESSSDCD